MISDQELLEMACEFDVGPEPILNGDFGWWERYPNEAKRHRVFVKKTGDDK